jgi:hypothetical protein
VIAIGDVIGDVIGDEIGDESATKSATNRRETGDEIGDEIDLRRDVIGRESAGRTMVNGVHLPWARPHR